VLEIEGTQMDLLGGSGED